MLRVNVDNMHRWSEPQRVYRRVLVALRDAYYHDRSKLFWARHRLKVEMYKYGALEPSSPEAKHALGIGFEVADFIAKSMRFPVQRVVEHNELVARLPMREAKACRERFLAAEHDHEVWAKQRIKGLLRRRPVAPYPYAYCCGCCLCTVRRAPPMTARLCPSVGFAELWLQVGPWSPSSTMVVC
jgi:hypothetical protein